MKVRASALVSGRVQGVFFRAYTCEKARELGVLGWVKNLPDGRVEAMIEGESGDVDRLLIDLKKGPPYARVDRIDVTYEDYLDEFKDFQMRSHFDKM